MICPKCGGSGALPEPGYLRKLRESKGIQLREIARQMNFSAAYVSDVERGNRTPNDKFLRKYKAALDSFIVLRKR